LSIEFRTHRCKFAASQFLSMLCGLREGNSSDYFYLLCLVSAVSQSVQTILDDVETFLHLVSAEIQQIKDNEKDSKKKKDKEKKDKKKEGRGG